MENPYSVLQAISVNVENTLRRLSDEGICTPFELERTRRYCEKLRAGKKAEMISETARKLDVLGDPDRLLLVMLIRRRELCVCEVTHASGLTQSMASYQLGMLEKTGIVRRRKSGKWAFYSLADIQFLDPILNEIDDSATVRRA